MEQQTGTKRRSVPFFDSLQVKYALSYLAVFAVILILLNTYPLIASQDLLFTSKRDGMKAQANTIQILIVYCDKSIAPQNLIEKQIDAGFQKILSNAKSL